MSEHTPGPWEVDRSFVLKGTTVANCFNLVLSQYECEANAARIVACVNAMEGVDDPELFREEADADSVMGLANDEMLRDAIILLSEIKGLIDSDNDHGTVRHMIAAKLLSRRELLASTPRRDG